MPTAPTDDAHDIALAEPDQLASLMSSWKRGLRAQRASPNTIAAHVANVDLVRAERDAVSRHTLASLAIAVPTAEFAEEFTSAARAPVGGPYGFAATVLFLRAAEFISESLQPAGTSFRIAYVFESG